MNFREYIAYVKDNREGLWFKARWYGWGWVPAKWQGWAIIAGFIIVLLLNGFYLDSKIPADGDPEVVDFVIFFGVLLASISALFWICYTKGEKPHWSWGDPRKK